MTIFSQKDPIKLQLHQQCPGGGRDIFECDFKDKVNQAWWVEKKNESLTEYWDKSNVNSVKSKTMARPKEKFSGNINCNKEKDLFL